MPIENDKIRIENNIINRMDEESGYEKEKEMMISGCKELERQKEENLYRDIILQANADLKSKIVKRDMTQLSMRERLAAKIKKEEVIKKGSIFN